MYMRKTQIHLPEDLYQQLKALAAAKEWSLSETLRRGAEYLVVIFPEIADPDKNAKPPQPIKLGKFKTPANEWREIANLNE